MPNGSDEALHRGIGNILKEGRVIIATDRLQTAMKGGSGLQQQAAIANAHAAMVAAITAHPQHGSVAIEKLKRILADLGESHDDDGGDGGQPTGNTSKAKDDLVSVAERAAYGKNELSMLRIIRANESPTK